MSNPLRDLFFGRRVLVEAMEPRRSLADVVLPPATRQSLQHALLQIRKHDLIFNRWGLAERHDTGLGLAFNFAGPPGTGKTICAEGIAHELGKRLLVVRYSEVESMWAGETGRNVAAVFRTALEQDAVLFFDEADAIATRRFTDVNRGYEREANTVVNVLLRELDVFHGVVIFATNLAANFDPAFERRIRTHILFEMPGVEERSRIWELQLHPERTPLGRDVDFRALAERFEVSGGDIKNAVLKAAQMAAGEPGPDAEKRIQQHHFEVATEQVVAARGVMRQSIFDGDEAAALPPQLAPLAELRASQESADERMSILAERLMEVEDALTAVEERRQAVAATEEEARQASSRAVAEMLGEAEASRRRSTAAMVAGVFALVVAVLAVLSGVLIG
jgi:SpoVK/Ycf46/Vps4 family AAA+-type ATPase